MSSTTILPLHHHHSPASNSRRRKQQQQPKMVGGGVHQMKEEAILGRWRKAARARDASYLLQVAMTILAVFLLISRLKWTFFTPLSTFEFKEPPTIIRTAASNATTTVASKIPKIIHQSYKSADTLPEQWAQTPTRWKELHPDYEYKFWSDYDNRELIATHYAWFLPVYDSYRHAIQRADAARYFCVLHYGGFYADLDILPLRDVSPLLQYIENDSSGDHQHQLLVAETYNLGLTNALFAGVRNSSVLNDFVHTLPDHTHPFYGLDVFLPHFGILLSTGPTRFWIFLNNFRDKIVTLPPSGWGQCHQCMRQKQRAAAGQKRRHQQCTVQPNSYFETVQGGSWHKWDTQCFNFIFCFPQFFTWLVCGALLLVGNYYYHCIMLPRRRRRTASDMEGPNDGDGKNGSATTGSGGKERTAAAASRQYYYWSTSTLASLWKERSPHSVLQTLVHQLVKRKHVVAYFVVLWALYDW